MWHGVGKHEVPWKWSFRILGTYAKKHRKLTGGLGFPIMYTFVSFRIWPLLLLFFGHRLEGPFVRLRPWESTVQYPWGLKIPGSPRVPKRYPWLIGRQWWNNALGVLRLWHWCIIMRRRIPFTYSPHLSWTLKKISWPVSHTESSRPNLTCTAGTNLFL